MNSIGPAVNNQQPDPITLPYDSDTKFRRARLNLFAEGDCKTIAGVYNNPTGGESLSSLLTSYAAAGCHARVVTSAKPADPYLPPNPIRTLSFQPIP